MFTVENTVEKIHFFSCSLLIARKAEEITGNKLIVLLNVDMFWYFFSKNYLFHKTNQYIKS